VWGFRQSWEVVALRNHLSYCCGVQRASAVAALAVAMTITSERLRRAAANAVDPLDIGLLQLAAERGEVRPRDVADHLDINPSSVTRHARVLVEMGQVTVSADPTDGRGSLIRLTDAGRARLQQIFDEGVASYGSLLEGWSTPDIQAFTTYLERLSEALQAAQQTGSAATGSNSRG
jgi:DNA-binding MarR family transcriptional regulator